MKKHLFLLAIGFAMTACASSSGDLSVKDAWSRPAAQGETGAVYFTIDNATNADDSLVGASAVIAGSTEIHMSMVDSNGVMSMTQMGPLPVKAGEQLAFEPGGYHVMLIGLQQDLNPGDTFPLTLQFQNKGDLEVEVTVRAP